MSTKLKSQDRILVQRCSQGPLMFTYEPGVNGHAKLVRSTISQSQRKHLHRLALAGLLAEKVTGCGGVGEPPTTSVAFSITALGREAIGIHCPVMPPIHVWKMPSDEQLAREGLE